jgi:hypothetical protein
VGFWFVGFGAPFPPPPPPPTLLPAQHHPIPSSLPTFHSMPSYPLFSYSVGFQHLRRSKDMEFHWTDAPRCTECDVTLDRLNSQRDRSVAELNVLRKYLSPDKIAAADAELLQLKQLLNSDVVTYCAHLSPPSSSSPHLFHSTSHPSTFPSNPPKSHSIFSLHFQFQFWNP